jgi:hypothetical protein
MKFIIGGAISVLIGVCLCIGAFFYAKSKAMNCEDHCSERVTHPIFRYTFCLNKCGKAIEVLIHAILSWGGIGVIVLGLCLLGIGWINIRRPGPVGVALHDISRHPDTSSTYEAAHKRNQSRMSLYEVIYSDFNKKNQT